MSHLELDIGAIQYPQVNGGVIRSSDKAVVDVSGHYSVSGATDAERQENLEIEMFKRGKSAFVDYDRQKQIDDHNKEIQESVKDLEGGKVNQPTAPGVPTLTVQASDGKLKVSGVADSATTRLVVSITGSGDPSTTTDEDGNEVDNTVRVDFQETITTGLPDYAVEIAEPTITVAVKVTAYNKIDDQAVAESSWSPPASE